jgi:hypothetical protein
MKEQLSFRRNLTTEKATYALSNEIVETLNKNFNSIYFIPDMYICI